MITVYSHFGNDYHVPYRIVPHKVRVIVTERIVSSLEAHWCQTLSTTINHVSKSAYTYLYTPHVVFPWDAAGLRGPAAFVDEMEIRY